MPPGLSSGSSMRFRSAYAIESAFDLAIFPWEKRVEGVHFPSGSRRDIFFLSRLGGYGSSDSTPCMP